MKVFCVLSIFLLGVSAQAAWNSACDSEVKELCPAYESDEGKSYCLFKHYNQLSKWCRGNPMVNDFIVLTSERLIKCKKDIENWCPRTLNQNGRLSKCLMGQLSKLTELCRSGTTWEKALAEEKYVKSPEFRAKKRVKKKKVLIKRKKIRQQADLTSACSFETYFYCREAKKVGRLEACLQEHRSQVRAPCKKALLESEAFHAGAETP